MRRSDADEAETLDPKGDDFVSVNVTDEGIVSDWDEESR